MPAGFTHMTISRVVLDHGSSEQCLNAKDILNSDIGLYLLGCVTPDIPYMGNLDNNPFTGNKEVADHLHYLSTNQIPLRGLAMTRKAFLDGDQAKAEALYAFFVGYASHVIADGVIHPFVRDMVGDYEVAATAHRLLEMKLDVLVAKKFLEVEVNGVSLQEDLDWIKDSPNLKDCLEATSYLLKDIYGHELSVGDLSGLVTGMKRALNIAEGKFPKWYSNLFGEKAFAYMDMEDVEKQADKLTNLTLPVDSEIKGNLQNYLKKNKVNFFEDALPIYFDVFSNFIEKSYAFVFEGGPAIDELIPEINLDNGRLLANQDLKETPILYGHKDA